VSDRKAIQRRLDSYKQRLGHAYDKQNPWAAIDETSLDVAGQFFFLDPSEPIYRECLLYVLADVLFGKWKTGRPAGSNVAWDFNRYFRLYQLYHVIKHDNPKLGKTEIAKLICKYPEFKYNSPEQVRQRISRAFREHAEHARRSRECDEWLKKMSRNSSSV
jgi:hypothetical protein